MNIGSVIRRIRKQKGHTLEELAYYAKTTASNLSRIELGKHAYSPEMLENIAQALEVSVSSLFAQAEATSLQTYRLCPQKLHAYEQKTLKENEATLLANYSKLTDEQRELLSALLSTMLTFNRNSGQMHSPQPNDRPT